MVIGMYFKRILRNETLFWPNKGIMVHVANSLYFKAEHMLCYVADYERARRRHRKIYGGGGGGARFF